LIGVGVAVAVLAVLAVVIRVAVKRLATEDDGPAGGRVVRKAEFLRRPKMDVIEAGVRFCEVRLDGEGPGQRMKLWLYLPPPPDADRPASGAPASSGHAARSLPCVLVAPAGTPLIWGIGLGSGDRAEHLPYIRAGFAVLAYELDGAPDDPDSADDREVAAAVKAFVAAEGGLANARTAMEYLIARVPEVNPRRVYCAGHSSAGTVALQLAATDPRLKGCAAYAPAVDIAAHQGAALAQVERIAPGVTAYARQYSPVNLPRPKCPVLLFHAADDQTVRVADSRRFAAARGPAVRLMTVPTGGHFDAMIEEGIPAGIRFLSQIDEELRN
jgi:dienelactone hydrolase